VAATPYGRQETMRDRHEDAIYASSRPYMPAFRGVRLETDLKRKTAEQVRRFQIAGGGTPAGIFLKP
jgi:hypothetical protein